MGISVAMKPGGADDPPGTLLIEVHYLGRVRLLRAISPGVIIGSRRPLMLYKIPLILEPQPEGGYTVSSPLLPELATEGDTADEA